MAKNNDALRYQFLKMQRALLIEQLSHIEHKIESFETASPRLKSSSEEADIDWEKQVSLTLTRATTPLSTSAISAVLEKKLNVEHRKVMRRVSQVLVGNKHKNFKKVKVGKSYQYDLNT